MAAAGGALREICSKGPGNLIYDPPEDSRALAGLLEQVCERGEGYALQLRGATRERISNGLPLSDLWRNRSRSTGG